MTAGASKIFVDRIQNRAFNISNLVIDSIRSLEHRRTVGALSIFYKYFHGIRSRGISSNMLDFKRNVLLLFRSNLLHKQKIIIFGCSTRISRTMLLCMNHWNQPNKN